MDRSSVRCGIPRWTLIILASTMFLVAQFGVASAECYPPSKWRTKADAAPSQYYINETTGSFLLEFTKGADSGDQPEGAPFYASIEASPGIYRFRTAVSTGNAQTDFVFSVEGATDAGTGEPIEYKLSPFSSRTIDRQVRVLGGRVDLKIRSETIGKTWSNVGPTELCK